MGSSPPPTVKIFLLDKSTKHSHQHCTLTTEMLPRDAFQQRKQRQNAGEVTYSAPRLSIAEFGGEKEVRKESGRKTMGRGERRAGNGMEGTTPQQKFCLGP